MLWFPRNVYTCSIWCWGEEQLREALDELRVNSVVPGHQDHQNHQWLDSNPRTHKVQAAHA